MAGVKTAGCRVSGPDQIFYTANIWFYWKDEQVFWKKNVRLKTLFMFCGRQYIPDSVENICQWSEGMAMSS